MNTAETENFSPGSADARLLSLWKKDIVLPRIEARKEELAKELYAILEGGAQAPAAFIQGIDAMDLFIELRRAMEGLTIATKSTREGQRAWAHRWMVQISLHDK
jgi:hypothetical protein